MLDTCRKALEVSSSQVLMQRDSLGCRYADVRSALGHLAAGFCRMKSPCRRRRKCVKNRLVVTADHSAARKEPPDIEPATILLPSELWKNSSILTGADYRRHARMHVPTRKPLFASLFLKTIIPGI